MRGDAERARRLAQCAAQPAMLARRNRVRAAVWVDFLARPAVFGYGIAMRVYCAVAAMDCRQLRLCRDVRIRESAVDRRALCRIYCVVLYWVARLEAG